MYKTDSYIKIETIAHLFLNKFLSEIFCIKCCFMYILLKSIFNLIIIKEIKLTY